MQGIDAEIEQFFQEGIQQVKDRMAEVGEIAVEYNKTHGNYKNRTGNLRRSNYFKVDDDYLTIGNSADYASNVEARGYMVCSDGALLAEQMLNDGD